MRARIVRVVHTFVPGWFDCARLRLFSGPLGDQDLRVTAWGALAGKDGQRPYSDQRESRDARIGGGN